MLSHAALDTVARAIDGHPWIDVAVEAALLISGAVLYAAHVPLAPAAQRRWRVVTTAILALQLAWNGLVTLAPALA